MTKAAPTPPPKTKKSVVVVEDDAELQAQIVDILQRPDDIECTYAASSAEEALQYILSHPPDVVVMDIKLPGMSGINCVAKLKKALPSIEIIMLTIYEDSESIFRALKAGANGYLIKSGDPDTLLGAIRDVHTGGAPFSSHIARKVAQHFRHEEKRSEATEMLSPREQEVLELLSRGYIYKEIADKLDIQTETVRWYVKNICAKMHVRSRLEAVAKLKS
ncbi:MAG TPA: response regulator transcription factor [Chthoniobacterales bacterium]|jgi:DNA-binding NarL/FixJ family response regulator|nr:response regulator transcription factor [Chthoniobacterales bacterium]